MLELAREDMSEEEKATMMDAATVVQMER